MTELYIVNEEVKGTVYVTSNTQFNNINAEHVHIAENITARLYGVITHSVHLKKGSKLYLHGTFTGKITNDGGEFNIY